MPTCGQGGTEARAAITYASDNENVATVTPDGVLMIKVKDFVGTVKITASFAVNDTYQPSTASYQVMIVAAIFSQMPMRSPRVQKKKVGLWKFYIGLWKK